MVDIDDNNVIGDLFFNQDSIRTVKLVEDCISRSYVRHGHHPRIRRVYEMTKEKNLYRYFQNNNLMRISGTHRDRGAHH